MAVALPNGWYMDGIWMVEPLFWKGSMVRIAGLGFNHEQLEFTWISWDLMRVQLILNQPKNAELDGSTLINPPKTLL